LADEINQKTSKEEAKVYAQTGLNLFPWPNNNTFCAFSAQNRVFNEINELSVEVVTEMVIRAETEGDNTLFQYKIACLHACKSPFIHITTVYHC
jgi:hypothetical protein